MTHPKITREEVESLMDLKAAMTPVHESLEVACKDRAQLARFISRYASLNGWFGSSVACLAGKIGRCRTMFLDPSETILDLADRSVLVGSYFFDAARDEFDDRDTPYRDTHRCLAQAMLKGILRCVGPTDPMAVNALLDPPIWLQGIGAAVAQGYGVNTPEQDVSIFRSIGYHIGSEILADMEFTYIDQAMRKHCDILVEKLSTMKVRIADQEHNAYAWISIHSSLTSGGAKEVEHFNWATQGANVALMYTPHERREPLRHQIHLGFLDFARDHQEFFTNVSKD
jgi:hypothetical protein